MKPTAAPIIACTIALLVAASCTQRDEETARQVDTAPVPAHTVAGVDDFRIGTASADSAAITDTKSEFAAGEPIYLSMAVDVAAAGKVVTTYWYGPEDHRLAYETKVIPANQERLRFMQENTFDWQGGQYRAEVWVGNEKVGEQQFQIVSAG